MKKLLLNFKKRRKDRLIILLAIIALFSLGMTQDDPCHIVRTYEIDGLTYADYVSGDNAFHCVYIEDVPQHVREGRN